MKHLLIANPNAGSAKERSEFTDLVARTFKDLDYDIYYTVCPKSCIPFIKEYLKKNSKDTVRIYACGGDGTVHEVANALMGCKNGELAIYCSGTGNDFVKSYAKTKNYNEIVKNKAAEPLYKDFQKLINGKTKSIDVSKITSDQFKEPLYSINVINFGFDAIVGARGNYYKENGLPEKAIKKGLGPYDWALKNDAMKHGRFNEIEVYADGEKLSNKKILLTTLAQGQFVGGSFWCAPKSDNTDGLIDVCVINAMSFLHLGLIIKCYTEGRHLNKKKSKFNYRQAKKVEFRALKEIDVCVDGEMIKGKNFAVECIPNAIKLVLPE